MNPWEAPEHRSALQPLRDVAHRARVAWRDRRHNRRTVSPSILVLRQQRNNWNHNDHFLAWVRRRAPEAARRFVLRRVPGRPPGVDGHALLLPWLQDPVRERFPDAYATARVVERTCTARDIPVVNPLDALSNAIKPVAARIIGSVGIRTPRMVPIDDPAAFVRDPGDVTLPFIVRESMRHGAEMILVETWDALRRVDFARFQRPIASMFIDTRGPDGLHRRYRHLTIGDAGIPQSLRVSPDWRPERANRVFTPAAHAAEEAYLEHRDPEHDALQRARRALGLDVVAFDYGYDPEGHLVVFEPNPLPNLSDPTGPPEYQHRHRRMLERLYTTLLRYYFARAGLEDPLPAHPIGA